MSRWSAIYFAVGVPLSRVKNLFFSFLKKKTQFHIYYRLASPMCQPWQRDWISRGSSPEQRLVGMFLFAGWIAVKKGNVIIEDWTVLLNQGRGANGGEPLPHDSRGSSTGMKSEKTYFFRFRRALTLACFALIILFIRKKAEMFILIFRILPLFLMRNIILKYRMFLRQLLLPTAG